VRCEVHCVLRLGGYHYIIMQGRVQMLILRSLLLPRRIAQTFWHFPYKCYTAIPSILSGFMSLGFGFLACSVDYPFAIVCCLVVFVYMDCMNLCLTLAVLWIILFNKYCIWILNLLVSEQFVTVLLICFRSHFKFGSISQY